MPSRSTKHKIQEIAVPCDYPGCSKTFRRLVNLSRHKLNHTTATHECGVCNRKFKRLDVLAQHRARHEKHVADLDVANLGHPATTLPQPLAPSLTLPPRPVISDTPFKNSQTSPTLSLLAPEPPPDPAPIASTSANGSTGLAHQGDGSTVFNWGYYGLTEQPDWESLLAFLGDPQEPGDLGETPTVTSGWNLHLGESVGGGHILEKENGAESRMETEESSVTSEDSVETDRAKERDIHSTITEMARMRLLVEVPDLLRLGSRNPVSLSASSMSVALKSYWDHFSPQLPIIHRPTFDPSTANPFLVILMICIGSYCLPQPDITFADVSLSIRSRLVLSVSSNLSTELYQIFLLCQVYDEYMSTASAHFSAQVFSSTIITITRRMGLLVQRRKDALSGTEEERWKGWVELEETTRVAYAIHFLDAMLPVAWGQMCTRRQGIFSTRLPLPSSPLEWEAGSAEEWAQVHDARFLDEDTHDPEPAYMPAFDPQYQPSGALPGFSSSLKSALNIRDHVEGAGDPWTRLMLLKGLSTVVWDLQTRGSVGILFQDGLQKEWKVPIRAALLRLGEHPWSDTAAPSAIQLYEDCSILTLLALLADVVSLQIFCGMDSVAGCLVGPHQRAGARAKLLQWANGPESGPAVWHAAEYLEGFYLEREDTNSSVVTQWAVLVATMTCLVFALIALPTPGSGRRWSASDPPKSKEATKKDAMTFLRSITIHRPEQLRHLNSISNMDSLLLACVYQLRTKAQNWEVAGQAANALEGLVPSLVV
ncbi:hypothetical protein T439DRAFT_349595, partial [Meredithblackwellia eburnea MCA 4105]